MDVLEIELTRIVQSTPWLVRVLRAVRSTGPPQSYVAAGAIRNTVWDSLHGRAPTGLAADVDVVYFQNFADDIDWSRRLSLEVAEYDWDVTNQATVHSWQSQYYNRVIPPYVSLDAALETWPETATAVGVRLDRGGGIEIVAPFGLGDLFQLKVCPSPMLLAPAAFRTRLQNKNWLSRWPRLRVVP